jgi:ribosomal protein S12 methylthiotransferase
LLDWLKEADLDRVGCFPYSPVEGAKANEIADPVPEEVKQERYERFHAVGGRDFLRRACRKKSAAR